MYKNYLNDYILRNSKNHPLSACKLESAILNTTNNNLIQNQKELINILLNIFIVANQYPSIKKAKKNISAFNIRTNSFIGTFVTLHNRNLKNFFNKFIFSIIPNLKNWENLKRQEKFKNIFNFNLGFDNINLWYELKQTSKTGLHLQLIIKQMAKNKDFLYFLSKLSLQK